MFALAHREDDVGRLLLGHAPAGVHVARAVQQIEGWRMARHKLPTWAACDDILYPPRLAMEQCSSEATARYKASIVESRLADYQTNRLADYQTNRLADYQTNFFRLSDQSDPNPSPLTPNPSSLTDLTGGFGVDCAFMAEAFDEVTYVERNPDLCAIAAANFKALGLHHIRTVSGDGSKVLGQLPMQDWIYLDPARRDGAGRKMVSLADCEPDVVRLMPLLHSHARWVMVKCSPMLDITQALRQLTSMQEVHVVSVQNECKELLFVTSDVPIVHAVSLRTDGSVESDCTFTPSDEQACQPAYADVIGRWLYEPNAALLKAGCFKLPAVRYGLQKLHPNSHLYTSDTLCTAFPGRTFEVVGSSGFGKHDVKSLLGDLRKANLSIRNFPDSVEGLRRRLHLAEGGDDYLFATLLTGGKKMLVRCRKVQI